MASRLLVALICLVLCWCGDDGRGKGQVEAHARVDSDLTYSTLLQQRSHARQEAARNDTEAVPVISYPQGRDGIRRQPAFPDTMPFPCRHATRDGRSQKRPSSVHRLRPGDVDVVGAMGDSLVAGNGALEEYALGTIIEYRGVSWCAGGQGTWREFLTLPNILKEFNPMLTGYSVGKGEFLAPNSHMNVAIPVSADFDALRQAKMLVRKMRKDKHVNFNEDWKVITIFFGANDLCSGQCFDKVKASAKQHSFKLQTALDYLQQHLPRTFVNLIPVLDVSVSVRVKRSLMCRLLHRLFCTCFHLTPGDVMEAITTLVRDYQAAERQLIESGRYNQREDFTVVIQPFMKLFNAPLDPVLRKKEVIDISYVTYDCFHFSQKGHAMAANLLWNNMLEPVGYKTQSRIDHVMEKFKCPTADAPFLFTYNNTQTYLRTGKQL